MELGPHEQRFEYYRNTRRLVGTLRMLGLATLACLAATSNTATADLNPNQQRAKVEITDSNSSSKPVLDPSRVRLKAYLSSQTIERLSIPDDLPDIYNTQWDEFHGSNAPINAGPSDFGMGAVDEKDEFMQVKRSTSGDWGLGLIVSKDRKEPVRCGWVEMLIVSDKKVYSPANNPCLPFWGILKNTFYFAKDLNGSPGKFVDGTPTKIIPSDNCNPFLFSNYATPYWGPTNMSYPDTPGGFYDKIRFVSSEETVWYRYTTKNNAASYVRIKAPNGRGGWGYIDRDCISTPAPKGNAKEKTSKTVPGANPDPDSKTKDQ